MDYKLAAARLEDVGTVFAEAFSVQYRDQNYLTNVIMHQNISPGGDSGLDKLGKNGLWRQNRV